MRTTRFSTFASIGSLLLATALFAGCGGEGLGAETDVDGTELAATTGSLTTYPLGAKKDSASTVSARRLVSLPTPGTLPTSMDLSATMPPVGNQGRQGSCVAWAIAYATKSYQENVEMSWSATSTAHQFSPAWVYNQINNGVDNGAYPSDGLNLIVAKGADTLSNFPYSDSNFTKQPDATSFSRAAHFKAKSWATLAASASAIKTVLASRNPVMVTIAVYPDFDSLNSTTNTVYDSVAGANRGYHLITLVGYDDARQAFKFINSWGTGWGSAGYGWLAYSLVPNSALGLDAYVLTDDLNTGAMGYGICGFGEPGCERAPVTLHRSVLNCNGAAISVNNTISLASYYNYTCESRYKAQCINDGTFDSFYMENCDYSGATCRQKGAANHYGCDPGAKPNGTCRPTVLHRKTYSCKGDLVSGETTVDLTNGYSNYTCSNRFLEQCVNDGSFNSYYSEWCEYTCQ